MRTAISVAVSLLAISLSGPARAADSIWEASSGLLPDQSCPPWTATISDTLPTFVNGALRIATSACPLNVSYRQTEPDLEFPPTTVVEAHLRYEWGDECLGPCGHYREPAMFAISTEPQVGIGVFVGDNELFLTNGECSGITSISLDTKTEPHTYRIEVGPTGIVTVYYDDSAVLTGHTYQSLNDFGTTPRIAWGEASILAYGVCHWFWVRHNAHASGCASSSAPPPGLQLQGRSVAWPNPFRQGTSVRCDLPQPGLVSLEVYDIRGRLLRRLGEITAPAGPLQIVWDGRDAEGANVPAGAYLCRVVGSGTEWNGKLVRLP